MDVWRVIWKKWHLDVAEDLIYSMPVCASTLIWMTLLGACRKIYISLLEMALNYISLFEPDNIIYLALKYLCQMGGGIVVSRWSRETQFLLRSECIWHKYLHYHSFALHFWPFHAMYMYL